MSTGTRRDQRRGFVAFSGPLSKAPYAGKQVSSIACTYSLTGGRDDLVLTGTTSNHSLLSAEDAVVGGSEFPTVYASHEMF